MTDTDITDQINDSLASFLPLLNANLESYIKNADLDPWGGTVVSDSYTLGSINLGICTAKVKAKYKIKKVQGLSSLQITSAVVDSVNVSNINEITGKVTLKGKLNDNLKAKLDGSVEASCGGIDESVGISGTAKAKNVKANGKGNLVANISDDNTCINSLMLTSLSLSYSDIDIDIDGLGIFNDFLDPLVDLLNDVFGDLISGLIASILYPQINNLLDQELPYCTEIQ